MVYNRLYIPQQVIMLLNSIQYIYRNKRDYFIIYSHISMQRYQSDNHWSYFRSIINYFTCLMDAVPKHVIYQKDGSALR